jgi:predicted Zn-dependent protease
MSNDWTEEDVYLIAERAHALYLQGRYREATVIFEGLVAVAPESSYCREALAALYLLLNEPERALAQLNELLARQPGHVTARARRCEAWLRAGRADEARRDFERIRREVAPSCATRLRLLLESPQPALPSGNGKQL